MLPSPAKAPPDARAIVASKATTALFIALSEVQQVRYPPYLNSDALSEVLHQGDAVGSRGGVSTIPTIGARDQVGDVVGIREIPAPESDTKRLIGIRPPLHRGIHQEVRRRHRMLGRADHVVVLVRNARRALEITHTCRQVVV